MKVYTHVVGNHCVLNYVYRASPDMGFHFHLLSEVGEPWQPQAEWLAEQLAKAADADVKQVELDCHP